MSAAFTPGPWNYTKSVCGGDVCFDIHQVEIDGKWVPGSDVAYSQFFKTYASENADIQDANAQLIAAAPELLEALRLTLQALEAVSNEMTVGERYTNAGQHLIDSLMPAREAIAKATGVTA